MFELGETTGKILGSVGLIGFIVFLYNWFLTKKLAGNHAEHTATQNSIIDTVKNIISSQNTVAQKIETSTQLSEEGKQKINDIIANAKEEIKEIGKQESISGVQTIIDDEWKDL